ncbi:hypothetical protein [Mesorhizobium sp. LNJC391B00]|uniref:hypothetical protein n=1 Tax=Mesorhizobium sp. LNJC391B00 TaxID=1287273 RepID=UPI0003CE286B|nr:hypothetical protein [Mesorhizobium sp. LNJC391B00]ESY21518.1 hypothetical protein X749_27875 [Mesorhizobium sp. LNJC391B00]
MAHGANSMADKLDQGHPDAHTPPPAELPGADPLDLLAGLPDGEGVDALALVAEIVAAPARARGRPLGSPNRKNGDMIRYLDARGHRDPMVTLSMLQSADFGALCKLVGAAGAKQKIAVLGIIRGAAADLMPYRHAKIPQQLDLVVPGQRPLMVFGNVEQLQVVADGDGYMSAGLMPDRAEKANEINGDAVRQPADKSHENANPLNTNDKAGLND